MAVAEAEGVPGMLRRIAERDPPVIPEAKSPSRRQMEVTGGRLKVMGRRRTIPREMVSPGVDPIKRPKMTPTADAKMFWGWRTSMSAAKTMVPFLSPGF